ncbi:MAG: hypothetical protein Q4G39_04140 [Brachymonas sp.]|nr:hypothetical protein [Brachymonas sp.]
MKPYAPTLSASPFFFKWVFPAFWLLPLVLFVVPGMLPTKEPSPLPIPMVLMPLLMGAIGFFFFKHMFWVLADEVVDEGDCLRVRKGKQEERIPFRHMLNVATSRLVNPPQISIRLRAPCSLGDEIIFLPKRSGKLSFAFALFTPFARNPIAEDLMLRVDAARRQL